MGQRLEQILASVKMMFWPRLGRMGIKSSGGVLWQKSVRTLHAFVMDYKESSLEVIILSHQSKRSIPMNGEEDGPYGGLRSCKTNPDSCEK